MLDVFPLHAPNPYFAARDGELLIAGRKISDIVASGGRTPLYVYDRSIMTRNMQELRAVLPDALHLHYAIKANPLLPVVEHFRGLVDGFDVASVGELEVALRAAMPADRISFAGPGKAPAELERAVEAGIVLNVESELELARVTEIAVRRRQRARVAIRVNPDFELKSSGMKMAGGPKPFGVDAERVPALLARIATLPVEFWGFHIFSGSQNLRPEALVESQQKTAALAIELARSAPAPVRLLNLGGGFGIPYFPGERPLDLDPIARNLAGVVPELRDALPEAELCLELGRYLVGEAGVYVCEVVDKKVSRGHEFLITNGGLLHHLAASGNFGQVIRKNYPVLVANRVGTGKTRNVSVVGPLCTPLDLLADRVDLPEADVGDWIAVFQSGAYGMTASPRGFLSHPEPAELCL